MIDTLNDLEQLQNHLIELSANGYKVQDFKQVLLSMYFLAEKHGFSREQINPIEPKPIRIEWSDPVDPGEVNARDVVMFADGSCSGNPGPGGWGVFVKGSDWSYGLGGGSSNTTNNRMELSAAISALQEIIRLKSTQATVIMDSKYVLDGISKWMHGWKQKNWRTAKGEQVANQDLWLKIDGLIKTQQAVLEWKWTKGHAGNAGNEQADQIASEQTELFRKK